MFKKYQFLRMKVISASLTLILLMGMFAGAAAAAPIEQSHLSPQAETTFSPDDSFFTSSVKKAVPHYENGVFSGNYHLVDEELVWLAIQYLLSIGADPTPANVDAVLHAR